MNFDSPDTWMLIAVAAAGLGGALGGWALLDLMRQARELTRLDGDEEVVVTNTRNPFFRTFLPVARRIGAGVRASFHSEDPEARATVAYEYFRRRLLQRLGSAGYPEGLNVEEYLGFCVLVALVYGGIGAVFWFATGYMDVWSMFAVGVLLGVFAMPGWLNRKARDRTNSIRKQLPFAMDLLTLATEAGLDFTSSLAAIIKKLGSTPLGEEFSLLLREIQLGKTRSEAMRDMARRVDVLEVQSVMSSLIQAEELGANLAPILRIQAAQQRERRSQRAEETANKAPVKMLFPLILIMGVTFIMIFGPMVVPMIQG